MFILFHKKMKPVIHEIDVILKNDENIILFIYIGFFFLQNCF